MHKLHRLLASRIASGLKRKTITSCSKWAEMYRIMGEPYPGPWRFDHHPWAREMHDCDAPMVIGQKAAQLAYTETGLNKTFYSIDVEGKSVLYVLPSSNPDASNFSTSRFDPALELSPHLQQLFSDVKNIGHKRAGNANLFVRGSRSRAQLKSIPVSLVIFDEVDEMVEDNIPLALERMSGQKEKQVYMLSTPTIAQHGISRYFEASSQQHFFFPCPHCGKQTELIFPECLVITADDPEDSEIFKTHLICKECSHVLDHASKPEWLAGGKWVAKFPDKVNAGFYINQLYSCTEEPWRIATSYLYAQSSPADEQEFYNSKLGVTHAVEGAQVQAEEIQAAIADYTTQAQPTGDIVTMGVDVGSYLHYEIDSWVVDTTSITNDINLASKCRVLKAGKIKDFEELDNLVRDYRIRFTVIDANPERRKALEFAQRFWGIVRLCFYGRGVSGKTIQQHQEEEHTITVDRTTWIDLALSRFRNHSILLPKDISYEYRQHIQAPVRVYEKDPDGNPVGRYRKASKRDDHYAHARTYAEIALILGCNLVASQDIVRAP